MLQTYMKHLDARVRAQRNKLTPQEKQDRLDVLPSEIAALCGRDPRGCLDLILQAIESATSPDMVIAIGDELLENLLNESSTAVADQVSRNLRSTRRFRQAFSFGNYASVDPAVIDEWVEVFRDLGTTKDAERKSLRSSRRSFDVEKTAG